MPAQVRAERRALCLARALSPVFPPQAAAAAAAATGCARVNPACVILPACLPASLPASPVVQDHEGT